MTSVFSMIIQGQIPGRFVWADELCVGFLTIAPVTFGHTLVVPRAEVDKWTDLDSDVVAHVMTVAHHIGKAQVETFGSERAGLAIAGFEVPHTHVHVWPVNSMADFNFAEAMQEPDPEVMDASAEKIRVALRLLGHGEHVPHETD